MMDLELEILEPAEPDKNGYPRRTTVVKVECTVVDIPSAVLRLRAIADMLATPDRIELVNPKNIDAPTVDELRRGRPIQ